MINLPRITSCTKAFSTMGSRISPRSVAPRNDQWNLFLEMNYTYMQENWPEKFQQTDRTTFIRDYSVKLTQRFTEGNRGLFIYYRNQDPIGFSNVYFTLLEKVNVLNIAEFYVELKWRGQKFGSEMLNHLISWGKEHKAAELRIEVDKDLDISNRFWSSFGYDLDSSGSRNVYSTNLQ